MSKKFRVAIDIVMRKFILKKWFCIKKLCDSHLHLEIYWIYLVLLLVKDINYFWFSTDCNIATVLAPGEYDLSSPVDILLELEYLFVW